MNMTQLECFATLAKTLNYVKTAELLNLTQPAVTKQIQSLENELDTKLFTRTTHSVSLTPIGEKFLSYTQTMLNTYYESQMWIGKYLEKDRYELRIGYSDPHVVNTMSDILRPVISGFDNIVPKFQMDQTDVNLNRLLKNQLDIVIGIKDASFRDKNVTFTKLRDERFFCACPAGHPLIKKISEREDQCVHSADLWEYRQIITTPPYLLKNYFYRGRNIVPVNDDLNNAICSTSNEAYMLLLAGYGYALLPEYELIPVEDKLVFYPWAESPNAPLGIYSRTDEVSLKNSAIQLYIQSAKTLFQTE